MRFRDVSLLAAASAVLLLTGCTSAPSTGTPSAEPSPTSTQTPAVDEGHLVVALDALTFTDATGSETAPYADPAAVIALLEKATGEQAAREAVENPPGYEMNLEKHTWEGLFLTASADGTGSASIGVTADEVAGIPVATAEGLAPGATREELLDAGAWTLVDTEDAATAAHLGLGGAEVPGTVSLTHPGEVGKIFVLFVLEGDTVTQVQMPSNDFSDL